MYEALLSLHPSVDAQGRFRLEEGRGSARKSSGSYYTPAEVVDRMLDLTLMPTLREAARRGGERGILSVRICDPSCGTGNFVIAAARRMGRFLAMARTALRPPGPGLISKATRDVLRACIFAVDVDPLAVEACRALLGAEGNNNAAVLRALQQNITCGDALSLDWQQRFPGVFGLQGGFDVVVGNPPFLNQLELATVHDRRRAAVLKERFGPAAAGYTDPSALFLLLSSRIARPGAGKSGGGRVALIQPQSLLAARDRAGVRGEVLAECSMESLWTAGERVFDAGVLVCCPVLRKGGPRNATLQRYCGRELKPVTPIRLDMHQLCIAPTWAPLAAAALGVPDLGLSVESVLGGIAEATADFRDQFYGLKGCVVEGSGVMPARRPNFPPLITTGLIDAAVSRWGNKPTRFAGALFTAPRVDLKRLGRDASLSRWAQGRLVPKVLLATQTRVLEAIVDDRGEWIPAVPVITVVPRRKAMLWHIAAVLLSPVASVWALREYGGSGLSASAIKLSAKQTMLVPTPGPNGKARWDAAAKQIRRAHRARTDAVRRRALVASASLMMDAFEIREPQRRAILEWWHGCGTRRKPSPKGQDRIA